MKRQMICTCVVQGTGRAWWPGRIAARHTLGRPTAALRQRGARGRGRGAPRTAASSERPSSPGSSQKRDISAPVPSRPASRGPSLTRGHLLQELTT